MMDEQILLDHMLSIAEVVIDIREYDLPTFCGISYLYLSNTFVQKFGTLISTNTMPNLNIVELNGNGKDFVPLLHDQVATLASNISTKENIPMHVFFIGMSTNTTITELYLNAMTKLRRHAFSGLEIMLRKNTTLQVLRVNRIFLTSATATLFINAIAENAHTSLVDISFSNCQLYGSPPLLLALQRLLKRDILLMLHLIYNNLSIEFRTALMTMIPSCPRLTRLSLFNVHPYTSITQLEKKTRQLCNANILHWQEHAYFTANGFTLPTYLKVPPHTRLAFAKDRVFLRYAERILHPLLIATLLCSDLGRTTGLYLPSELWLYIFSFYKLYQFQSVPYLSMVHLREVDTEVEGNNAGNIWENDPMYTPILGQDYSTDPLPYPIFE